MESPKMKIKFSVREEPSVFEVSPQDTVKSLFQKIEAKDCLEVGFQQLFLGGTMLDPEKTFEEQEVKEDSELLFHILAGSCDELLKRMREMKEIPEIFGDLTFKFMENEDLIAQIKSVKTVKRYRYTAEFPDVDNSPAFRVVEQVIDVAAGTIIAGFPLKVTGLVPVRDLFRDRINYEDVTTFVDLDRLNSEMNVAVLKVVSLFSVGNPLAVSVLKQYLRNFIVVYRNLLKLRAVLTDEESRHGRLQELQDSVMKQFDSLYEAGVETSIHGVIKHVRSVKSTSTSTSTSTGTASS